MGVKELIYIANKKIDEECLARPLCNKCPFYANNVCEKAEELKNKFRTQDRLKTKIDLIKLITH